eukprot:567110_1
MSEQPDQPPALSPPFVIDIYNTSASSYNAHHIYLGDMTHRRSGLLPLAFYYDELNSDIGFVITMNDIQIFGSSNISELDNQNTIHETFEDGEYMNRTVAIMMIHGLDPERYYSFQLFQYEFEYEFITYSDWVQHTAFTVNDKVSLNVNLI